MTSRARGRNRDLAGIDWGSSHPADLDRYQTRLTALVDYIAETGHARVPQSYVTADGIRLGIWLKARRQCWGENPALEAALEQLGVEPRLTTGAARWESSRVGWVRFVAEHHRRPRGNDPVPGGEVLARWQHRQVSAFRAGVLPAATVARLEGSAGWRWDATPVERLCRRVSPIVVEWGVPPVGSPLGRRLARLVVGVRSGVLPAADVAEAVSWWWWPQVFDVPDFHVSLETVSAET